MATVTDKLNVLKLQRKCLRGALTKAITTKDPANPISLHIVEDKAKRLFALDTDIATLRFDNGLLEGLEEENDSVEEYRNKFVTFMTTYSQKDSTDEDGDDESALPPVRKEVDLRLPKLSLRQFSGDVREWIGWWGQFRKIHESQQLEEDKFQLLVEATSGAARKLVEAYPPSKDNYVKAISALKSSFATDCLIVETYVQDLLSLVTLQGCSCGGRGSEKLSLADLLTEIETKVRALETMGLTSDKYAMMLYPLVRSTLPEDVVCVYQRHRRYSAVNSSSKTGNDSAELEDLLQFLRKEVDDERLRQATKDCQKVSLPTAASLVATSSKQVIKCLFCGKENHLSEKCKVAEKMSFDERMKKVAEKRACYRCLKKGHFASVCRGKMECRKCQRRHVELMCPGQREDDQKTVSAVASTCPGILLGTVNVIIIGKYKERTVRALCDPGSMHSYVTKSTAQALGLEVKGVKRLEHQLFGGLTTNVEEHPIYKVQVKGKAGSAMNNFVQMEVLAKDTICSEVPQVPNDIAKLLSQSGITLSDCGNENGPVDLLIGANYFGQLLTGSMSQLSELTALELSLGWIVMGKTSSKVTTSVAVSLLSMSKVKDMWSLESLGISDPIATADNEEEVIMDTFLKSVTVNEEGRYEIKLPFLEDRQKPDSNIDVARQRTANVSKRLLENGRFAEYDEVFKEWQQTGIVEKVQIVEEEIDVHYLPHRPVFKQNSTTAVRPVFDASATDRNKISLNSVLATGPNLIAKVPGILHRFRSDKVGVISDIKKCFLQVSISPKDREWLRFFWRENNEEICLHFNRLPFGLRCSPFIMAETLLCHLDSVKEYAVTANRLKESLYVDNVVTSVKNEAEFVKFRDESNEIMAKGKFELRGWVSSVDTQRKVESVLGLSWDSTSDTLFVDVGKIKKPEVLTRRSLLSSAHAIFDPYGITAAVTLVPKLLVQEAFDDASHWDTPLGPDIVKRFEKWFQTVHLLEFIKIPRFFGFNLLKDNCSVHVFVDASKMAMGMCVFIRFEVNGLVTLSFVTGRSRVAPKGKDVHIPRLELTAAVLGARLYASVKEALNLKCKVTFWSDSQCTLWWIKRNSSWKAYVSNRVNEIKAHSVPEDWRFVPGGMNPSDVLSRGCDAKTLLQSKWIEGPKWLCESPENWPSDDMVSTLPEAQQEEKTATLIATAEEIDIFGKYFSSWRRHVRMVAWIRRFIDNMKNARERRLKGAGETQEQRNDLSFVVVNLKDRAGKEKALKVNVLQQSEMEEAEYEVVKVVQRKYFTSAMKDLQKQLQVFYDEKGLLRVKTRLLEREDDAYFKCPILLPALKKGEPSEVAMLIRHTHMINMHAGASVVVPSLRERWWVLRAKKSVNEVIHRCVTCKRFSAKRANAPVPALPQNRVKDCKVFETTGIDLAGPVYLSTKDGSSEKAWIVLFTCAVYRAIHLEVVLSLSTEAFIASLRRFISRRGRVATIYSDNGTNFVGTVNLMKSVNWNEVINDLPEIKWIFNPPAGPWWGGWFERIFRILKSSLRRCLGNAKLNYEEFYTTLCELEAVVNNRVITYCTESPELVPLSPALFLQDLAEYRVPELDVIDEQGLLSRRAKYVLEVRDALKRRFRSEYLATLKSCSGGMHNLKLNDIVLIEDNTKRMNWKMARIKQLIPGKDGIPRVAQLQTKEGELIRPIQRLYPLEVGCPEINPDSQESEVRYHEIQSDHEESEVDDEVEEPKRQPPEKTTRSGRVSRPKVKLNL